MKTDIHEYAEEMPVVIEKLDPKEGAYFNAGINERSYNGYIKEKWVITALNEAGHNCTQVDLIDLLAHVKNNMPEVWESV